MNDICRSRRLRWITLTEVLIILDILRKPNPIIVLLQIQNSNRCKKRFAVKRLVLLTFQTAASHFCCFVIFTALRWLRHQRPITFLILFVLDSSVESFTIFGGNDVTTSWDWELTGERRPIRSKNEVGMYNNIYYCLNCFTFLKNQKQETKVKWPFTMTLNFSSGHVCFVP